MGMVCNRILLVECYSILIKFTEHIPLSSQRNLRTGQVCRNASYLLASFFYSIDAYHSRYSGGKAGESPVSFVGKGVTFDTGGISIKPSTVSESVSQGPAVVELDEPGDETYARRHGCVAI